MTSLWQTDALRDTVILNSNYFMSDLLVACYS